MLQQSTSARGFRQPRCSGCGLTSELCVCQLWAPLPAPLRVSVVMPPSEARSASNTARLLQLWLSGSSLHVRGAVGHTRPESSIEPGRAALLFPGGVPVEALAGSIEHLIVPDGTWSQARRIERHCFAGSGLPRVELDSTWPSAYGLRRNARGPCTFEAVAIALGLLASDALAESLLERFAEWARRAQLLKRGGVSPSTPTPEPLQSAPEHPALERLRARSQPRAERNAARVT